MLHLCMWVVVVELNYVIRRSNQSVKLFVINDKKQHTKAEKCNADHKARSEDRL